MKAIWYVLKCPKEHEREYIEKCQELSEAEKTQDVICFQYQRMLRYGGNWHLEERRLLPGYIFLSGTRIMRIDRELKADPAISLIPCRVSYLKSLCSRDNLIEISKGVIKDGVPVVFHGPLRGREHLIRKIDRHKRTAELEVPFANKGTRIIVGLEICEKQK